MPCRADALAVGMLLAIGWREAKFRAFLADHGSSLRRVLAVLSLGVLGLLWWLVHPLSLVTVTIGYTWLALFLRLPAFGGVVADEGRIAGVMRWKMLRGLGTISYCVYVIHLTINHLAHRILLHGEPEIYNFAGVGVTLLALALSVGVASLSWRYFEKPLIRRGHGYSFWGEAKEIPRASLQGLEAH